MKEAPIGETTLQKNLAVLPLTVWRGPLARTRRALGDGAITIGFIGGSITDAAPGHNWPEFVVPWFVDSYPGLRCTVENAAIGATGSDFAAIRARPHLIDRGCDLVFVEFAVNDFGAPVERRARSREGLLRQLLSAGCDCVLVHTYLREMYDDMAAGRVPASIADFERLAQWYGVSSVWMGLHALAQAAVAAGTLRYDAWLPDGLHPQQLGSARYAQSVTTFLTEELRGCVGTQVTHPPDAATPAPIPQPLNPKHWEHIRAIPFAEMETRGPWRIDRHRSSPWVGQVLQTTAPGAALGCPFRGSGCLLITDFGTQSADFRWRIDGGPWNESRADRPAWCGPSGWWRPFYPAEDLPTGDHALELEVIAAPAQVCGQWFRLAHVAGLP